MASKLVVWLWCAVIKKFLSGYYACLVCNTSQYELVKQKQSCKKIYTNFYTEPAMTTTQGEEAKVEKGEGKGEMKTGEIFKKLEFNHKRG